MGRTESILKIDSILRFLPENHAESNMVCDIKFVYWCYINDIYDMCTYDNFVSKTNVPSNKENANS